MGNTFLPPKVDRKTHNEVIVTYSIHYSHCDYIPHCIVCHFTSYISILMQH